MVSPKQNLNLARKWRPQTFEHVVGQELAIKMLVNSLMLNKLFPVYLFSGQRGCGKTSTARIFASALNCKKLDSFQHNEPNLKVPCLTCQSCIAMTNGDHPDFIEIDAASHTGVDNVRQIIDAASYMPLVGQKKVYLIDEAHMLSKAAFNACLKILEEPPATALFILATTEVPKIPVTIVSRCFQLIFNPITNTSLKQHLQTICSNEAITIDTAALDLIIDETDGSARDAINLLERIRFSSNLITEQQVLETLGKISMQDLFKIFTYIIEQKAADLIHHLGAINFEQRSPQLLWDMIIHVCRCLIWTKYGVFPIPGNMGRHSEELKQLASICSLNRLIAIGNLLWTQEEIFLKTTKKHLFLEMVLLQLCQQVDVLDLEDLITACKHCPTTAPLPPATQTLPIITQHPQEFSAPVSTPTAAPCENQKNSHVVEKTPSQPPAGGWGVFLQEIVHLNDPLLGSIFAQATFIKNNEISKRVSIQLSSDSAFFKNKINETKSLWQPIFERCFAGYQDFDYEPCVRIKEPSSPITQISPPATPSPSAPLQQAPHNHQSANKAENDLVTIAHADQWPQAALIQRYFPGKIRKIKADVL